MTWEEVPSNIPFSRSGDGGPEGLILALQPGLGQSGSKVSALNHWPL